MRVGTSYGRSFRLSYVFHGYVFATISRDTLNVLGFNNVSRISPILLGDTFQSVCSYFIEIFCEWCLDRNYS